MKAEEYVSFVDFGKHFEKQFKSEPKYDEGELPPEIEHYGQGRYTYLQDIRMEIDESPPTWEEIAGLLKSMKNGRSSGLDGIPMECMKYCEDDEMIKEIRKLQALIWEYEEVPVRWLDSKTQVLFKKGNRMVTSNYRGLSITNNLSRIDSGWIGQQSTIFLYTVSSGNQPVKLYLHYTSILPPLSIKFRDVICGR